MKIPLRYCQYLLVGGYVSFNVIAYVQSATSGVLSGDFTGFSAPPARVGLALVAAIVASYVIVMFPCFDLCRQVGRFKRPHAQAQTQPAAVHILVMALLVFQLAFALGTGIGTAGTFARTESPLRFIIYIIPIDLMALIYLAAADKRGLHKLNLAVYLLSSLVRGWSFGIALVLMIAAIRAKGVRIGMPRLIGALAFFCIAAPLLLLLRFFVREESVGVAEVLHYTDLVLDGRNIYAYILGFIIDRLQHFTSVAHIFENRAVIHDAFAAGAIRPFFWDGTFFAPIASTLGTPLPLELNSWLTAYFHNLNFDAVAYNTHLGLLGWPLVAPELLPVFLLYVGGLGAGTVLLSRATGSRHVIELTWLMWLLFLMNGWFGAFVNYAVALLFFRLLQLASRRSPLRALELAPRRGAAAAPPAAAPGLPT